MQVDLRDLLSLASHGPDTYIGAGPRYHWGGLFGGQIVAQAARAAAYTVDDLGGTDGFALHSLRAYFIRPGDDRQPIQFDVERLRTGRGFATRRVLARQSDGAILNLEASFQRPQDAPDVETVVAPVVPEPDEVATASWSPLFDRKPLSPAQIPTGGPGGGRQIFWMRSATPLGDDQLLHRCASAFMSDDLPCDAAVRVHPNSVPGMTSDQEGWWEEFKKHWFSASLDHAMWFHRPMRADEWQLFDVSCLSYSGGRGLTLGHIFAIDGAHVATLTQEDIIRSVRT